MRANILLGFLLAVASALSAVAVHAQINKEVINDARSSQKTITGAPFSADAVTESVQILSDGTRITRRSKSRIYRDSEGRYRRDESRKNIGVPGGDVEIAESIVIIDPVSGSKYELDVEDRTYKRSSFKLNTKPGLKIEFKSNEFNLKQEQRSENRAEKQARINEKEAEKRAELNEKEAEIRAKELEIKAKEIEKKNKQIENEAKEKERQGKEIEKKNKELENQKKELERQAKEIEAGLKPVSKTESLGPRTIEGVAVEGTRTTTTILTGAIGNDRDIVIVYEKWYSNDLQMTILSKHSDPRFGEQNYRLSNISRSDQPVSLFTPPADYKNDDDGRIKSPRVPAVQAEPRTPAKRAVPAGNIKPPAPSTPVPNNIKPSTPAVSKVPAI